MRPGEITLDGELDEPSWSEAPIASNFIQNDPREGEPATFDTEVRVLYDDDALYFGVFAKDDEPSRIIVNDLKKDFNTGTSDGFRIILDTFHDERNGYQFATNPAGAKWDAQMANEGRENNADWDGIWDVATRITETGWYAEIRIPFRTLKFTRQRTADLGRQLRAQGAAAERGQLLVAAAAHLRYPARVAGGHGRRACAGVRPGKNLRVKPYAASSSSTVARPAQRRGDFEAGFDVKYGVTTGLVWDFTVNTDFSQVEADEQQVNLTRFSLFFPEKRDFFLENSGIFQFGGGGGRAVVAAAGGGASNRAGHAAVLQPPDRPVRRRRGDPDPRRHAADRPAGRLFDRRAEHPAARATTRCPATNFTALRLRRDILANSDIGAMVLNKEEAGAHFNRVAGRRREFPVRVPDVERVCREDVLAGRGRWPAPGTTFASRAALRLPSRTWQVQSRLRRHRRALQRRDGVRPAAGRQQLRRAHTGRVPAGALSKWMRQTQPHWQFDMFTRQHDGSLEIALPGLSLASQLPGRHRLRDRRQPAGRGHQGAVHHQQLARRAREPGPLRLHEYFIFWNTNAGTFSVNTRYSVGQFYDGYRRQLHVRAVAAPERELQRLGQPADQRHRAVDRRVRLEAPDDPRELQLQHEDVLQRAGAVQQRQPQWTSNLRFNIIHRPLSDFFLVYNERRDERTGQMISRAVIAKMTYLMAF